MLVEQCKSTIANTTGEKGATAGQLPLPWSPDGHPLYLGSSFLPDSLQIKISTVRELGGVPPGRKRKAANLRKQSSLQPVLPQPQPDGAEAGPLITAPGSAGLALSPAGQPAASLVVGPRAVAAPPMPPPVYPAHYDLRHAFSGVASVESASGEAFHVGKTPKVAQPSIPAPEGPVPVVRPCPGRIRHFKI